MLTLLAREPDNADAWVELGLAHSASGDSAAGRSAFLRALAIAPDYDDAKLGLARLAYRSGDLEEARTWLQRVDPARMHEPEVESLRDALAESRAGDAAWRMDAYVAYSSLSKDLAPWREASWSLARRGRGGSVGAAIEYAERFGQSDVYGEVRMSRPTSAGTWGVALGGASHPTFKPEAAARLEFATAEDADWVFNAAASVARYAAGEVDRLGLSAGRRWDENVRVDALGIVVKDEVDEIRTGYGLAAAWRPVERLELSLVWADAPESSEGVTIDVRSWGLGVAIEAAAGLRLRLGVLREERDAFDRVETSLAVARTF